MSRYNYYDTAREAWDRGHRDSYRRNPYDRYGSFNEEEQYRAYEDGYRERLDEERKREQQEEEEAAERAYQRKLQEQRDLEQYWESQRMEQDE